jgi:hypothetical protein
VPNSGFKKIEHPVGEQDTFALLMTFQIRFPQLKAQLKTPGIRIVGHEDAIPVDIAKSYGAK